MAGSGTVVFEYARVSVPLWITWCVVCKSCAAGVGANQHGLDTVTLEELYSEKRLAPAIGIDRRWPHPYLMMTSPNGNIFRVTGHLRGDSLVPGEFAAQSPMTRSFDVCFDLRLNKRLSKQSWRWWFETPLRPLRRCCNVVNTKNVKLSTCIVQHIIKVIENLIRFFLFSLIVKNHYCNIFWAQTT